MDNRLKEIRLNAGLTQKELADKVFTSQQAVQQWETGKTVPQPDRLAEIAKALDCSVFDISYSDNRPDRYLNVDIDYSTQWDMTVDMLHLLPVTNDLEKFIKAAAIRYAEEQKRYCSGAMIYHLCLSEKEYEIYKFWKKNTYLPLGIGDTLFWECFFPQDFFLTTSEFRPLVAAKLAAVVEGLAGYEILIGKTDELQKEYYPELIVLKV